MSEQLKKCPFCGGKPTESHDKDGYLDTIGCVNCRFWLNSDEHFGVVNVWNTRSSPPAPKLEEIDIMIDEAIGALKCIRHEVNHGLKLSVRSQNLGYQALDKLMAFQQHGYSALAKGE